MDFPRTLLLSWQRPDGRYAGAEVLRKIVRELPRDRVRWAYLAVPMAGEVPEGMPERQAFPPRTLSWRLRNHAFHYWFVHNLQARAIARRIAAWAAPFRPQVIWALAEMGVIPVACHLRKRLGAPVHATAHDSYRFARFAMPRRYFPIYRQSAKRLLRHVRSMDAVSEELLGDIRETFPLPSLSGTMVFPPSISRSCMADVSARPAPRSRRRAIGCCGSVRVDAKQWTDFLRLLEALPFEFRLIVFSDRSAFFDAPGPPNVTLELQDYVRTEAEVVQRFAGAAVDACYLGLTRRPDQRMFSTRSLSSKLTTYAAAACPVIVDGPGESVAWRLVRKHGAGVLCDGDAPRALAELRRVFEDGAAWASMAAGAVRLCRAEFDLERNAARFRDLLCETAA